MKKKAPQPESASALVTANHFKAIVPKPNKTEIIEALTQIKIEELNKEIQSATERRDALAEECRQLVLAWQRAGGSGLPEVRLGCAGTEWHAKKREYIPTGKPSDVKVTFEISDLPSDISAKLMEYYEAKNLADRRFSPDGIRKQIKQKLAGGSKTERVDTLLADPESRKALQEALVKIAA